MLGGGYNRKSFRHVNHACEAIRFSWIRVPGRLYACVILSKLSLSRVRTAHPIFSSYLNNPTKRAVGLRRIRLQRLRGLAVLSNAIQSVGGRSRSDSWTQWQDSWRLEKEDSEKLCLVFHKKIGAYIVISEEKAKDRRRHGFGFHRNDEC